MNSLNHIEECNYGDSALWSFHFFPEQGRLEIILEYNWDRIMSILDKKRINPLANARDFRKLSFRYVKGYSRTSFHGKVLPNPDHYDFLDQNMTWSIDGVMVKRVKNNYHVRFACFSPFGFTSFICEDIKCYRMILPFEDTDVLINAINNDDQWTLEASTE
jgi:hypothetical protein